MARTDNANTTTVWNLINSATEKTTPVNADMVWLMDSEASNILKKLSWATIKSFFVDLVNNQTIAWIKTFTSNIITNAWTSAWWIIHQQWLNTTSRFKAWLVGSESSWNAWSNYRMYCYDDAWNFISEVYTIERSSSSILFWTWIPAPSSKIEIISTTKGFLPPRMTTTQKNAISTPAEWLMVYDTTLHKLCVKWLSGWETITSV